MKLTHPDKLYWPKAGITKAMLAGYFGSRSGVMLPYLTDRPLSLKRYPEGIEGASFFQKNISDANPPKFLKLATIPAKTVKKKVRYLVCNNKRTLAYLANIGALELHPWNSRLKTLQKPDYMVFDLDPGEQTRFADVVEAALELKRILDEGGMPSFIKTSGKRGLHVYVPLGARYSYERVRAFARSVAQLLVERRPALASLAVHPTERADKIYVDYLRNSVGQTVIAPYCPRATAEATVSMPLSWGEVGKGLDPKKFTLRTVAHRLKQKGDPWKGIRGSRANLDAAARRLGL